MTTTGRATRCARTCLSDFDLMFNILPFENAIDAHADIEQEVRVRIDVDALADRFAIDDDG